MSGRRREAAEVLVQAAAAGRLGHSLLLHGPQSERLETVARDIAQAHLWQGSFRPAVASHPDFHAIRPAGKLRLIRIDAVRAVIGKVARTGAVGRNKVVVLHDADRCGDEAANAFLKTLEEPPEGTLLLLLTTRMHAVLPTLRSRCQPFHLPAPGPAEVPAPLAAWRDRLVAWLGRIGAGGRDRSAVADHLFGAYGLVATGAGLLEELTEAHLTAHPPPAGLEEEEEAALRQGVLLSWRQRLLEELERTAVQLGRTESGGAEGEAARRTVAAVARVEEAARLLRYNLQTEAALEFILLGWMRLWVRSAAGGPRTAD